MQLFFFALPIKLLLEDIKPFPVDTEAHNKSVHLQEGIEKLASYLITVKAQHLLIVGLYYKNSRDYKRLQREYEAFNK